MIINQNNYFFQKDNYIKKILKIKRFQCYYFHFVFCLFLNEKQLFIKLICKRIRVFSEGEKFENIKPVFGSILSDALKVIFYFTD
jgi:hypothetical protein